VDVFPRVLGLLFPRLFRKLRATPHPRQGRRTPATFDGIILNFFFLGPPLLDAPPFYRSCDCALCYFTCCSPPSLAQDSWVPVAGLFFKSPFFLRSFSSAVTVVPSGALFPIEEILPLHKVESYFSVQHRGPWIPRRRF